MGDNRRTVTENNKDVVTWTYDNANQPIPARPRRQLFADHQITQLPGDFADALGGG